MRSTLEQRKARFEAEGISVREWARDRGFSPRTVYAVLNGQLKAKRGVSHRIAVALGIKPELRSSDA
ncbi:DNA-binding protein [Xanthobacter aminoxidans]|uniref:DNA-binding protein n=1 Tax=Xanthobacter aminoxidans TaxID=186280 RepID=UPI002022DEA8|nr:DNA-binding protein [Xanthobacter aminoxidans]MCL8381774.1 DNA-binding protein [Xanthobacter aminoxidans]